MSSFSSGLPVLAPSNVLHAISLIQAAYAPLQSALLAMQHTFAAWGLILPLLAHPRTRTSSSSAPIRRTPISRVGSSRVGACDGGWGNTLRRYFGSRHEQELAAWELNSPRPNGMLD
ncbi:hypothetical protein B0H19DRAFT_1277252 [Mycena capillaripes]|nr:hypothetical protein B0H19DRAFT_1277252 [Mycena capillaripes]